MQISPRGSSSLVQFPIQAKSSIKKHQPLVFHSVPKTKINLTLHATEEDPQQLRLHIKASFEGKPTFSGFTESTVASSDKCPELFDEVLSILKNQGINDLNEEYIRKKLSKVKQIGGSGETDTESKSPWWAWLFSLGDLFSGFRGSV